MNWIVTVCRNGLGMTKRAVESFLSQDVGDVRILVLDNKSTDGTREWLSAQPVNLVCFEHPKSVAESWNYGLRWVYAAGNDYALVCNNDVILPPWHYRLLLEDGGGFVTGVGCRDIECLTVPPRPESRRPNPDFSSFMCRRWVFEKLGGFDERFLIGYGEDCAAHCRMHQLGIPAYCIEMGHYHEISGTMRANPDEAPMICAQADRNRELFERLFGFKIPPDDGGKYEEFFSKPYRV